MEKHVIDRPKWVVSRAHWFLEIIEKTIYENKIAVEDVYYHEGRLGNGEWKPFTRDMYWGKNDVWFSFKAEFTIPEAYEGKCVKMMLSTGREGLWNANNPQIMLTVNGESLQTLDTNHKTFYISQCGKAGEKITVEFEAYSGRQVDAPDFAKSPLIFYLDAYCHNFDAENLLFDIKTAKYAAKMYEENNPYRINIENYITNALNLLDMREPFSKEYKESVKEASKYMQEEFYGKYCGCEDAVTNCIGHTHIDVAWLWTVAQTREKALRSFTTELNLLDEFPEHKFTSSQPQLYQFVKEKNPEIYARIKDKVAEGRWEVEGAMWLEADCNLTSGESLVRQILHGKRFMKQEFGVDSKILWLPDVFGYSAALPQILLKSGIDTFVTSKISWSEFDHFPYDTFIWKGIDGSEIFTQFILSGDENSTLNNDRYFCSTYNSMLTPVCIAKGWELYQQKDICNETLLSFGYGDGGGGVTREMLLMQRRTNKGIPGTPKTRITTVNDAISRIKNKVEGKKIPKWVGELYLELHRGTYTSMARNKKFNRMCEFLLQHTETSSLANKLLLNGAYEKEGIYNSWTTLLLNQFHDIIPGSSIKEVYDDSDKDYAKLIEENTTRSNSAIMNIAESVNKKGIFVYNSSPVEASGIVEVNGNKYYAENIPALGYKVINPVSETESDIIASINHMENRFFSIDIDEKGHFTSIFDKINNREVITKGEKGNVLIAYDDHPRAFDNWEITSYYKEKYWIVDDVEEINVIEISPLSASIEIKRKFLKSTIRQVITIYRDIDRIDFDTDMDWHEHGILLKTSFPVDILSDKATFEIQYGAVERPTHFNTTWDAAKFEVCAHKWMDYAEPNYGVAILNDCKYGCDIHDSVMSLTLLKCGKYPNYDADQGHHSFKYAVVPHNGNWREAQIPNKAYEFNCPLISMETDGEGNLPESYSIVSVDKKNIIVSAVKEACDNEDVIIRLYEAYGERTEVSLTMGFEFAEVYESDLIETECINKLEVNEKTFSFQMKPYEIKTFRVKKER